MKSGTFSKSKSKICRKSFTIILSVLLVLISTFYSYMPSFDNEFLYWDDQFYVTDNYDITHPDKESLKRIATRIVSLNYHPLTMLSFWINAKIYGTSSAKPFILTNVILHVLNVALVFMLTFSLSNSKFILAITTAILFALHPMHIESVVWVSERKDMLYGFFFLCSIIVYWNYTRNSRLSLYALSFILFTLACLSKATAVSLVPCLLLIDLISKRNLKSIQIIVDKIPFLTIGLVVGIIALNVQSGGDFYGILDRGQLTNAYGAYSDIGNRITNGLNAHFYYLYKFVYPCEHSAFHPYSMAEQYSLLEVLLVFTLTVILLIWSVFMKRRDVLFGIGFYCFTIFLVLQFLPVGSAIVAERYTYLPYIGLGFLLGIGLESLASKVSKNLTLISLAIVSIFCVRNTRLQANMWQNHTTLFNQATMQYPEDAFIRRTLASGYWAEGQIDSAFHHINYAIHELGCETSQALELLANCYSEKGTYEEANLLFDKAVLLDSDNVSAKYHRGLNLLNLDPQKALEDFDFCEQTENTYFTPLLYGPRGRAYGLLGQYEFAIRELDIAIELYPNDPNFYLDRAVTYDKIGKIAEATSDYKKVLELDPDNNYASERLAIISDIE